LRVFERHPLRNDRRTQQVGKTDSRRTRAKEQVFLVFKLDTLELARVDHSGKCDARSALHVVIVDAIFVAIALEQVDGVCSRPILKVDAAFREHFLHRLNEFVDERIQLVGRWPGLAHAEIEWIAQVLLIVGTGVEIHGQQVLRRYSSAGGVELELADGNARPVCAKVAEAEYPAAVRDADKSDVLLRPVSAGLP